MAAFNVNENDGPLFIGSDFADVFNITDADGDDWYYMRVYGLGGNDLYRVTENFGDFQDYIDIFETAGGGVDTIRVENDAIIGRNYTLADNVEHLQFVPVFGLSNHLTGNALANSISTSSKLGIDTLDGGAGNDTLAGGDGTDYYYVDSSADLVVEAANGGYDAVYATASYTLPLNVEELYLHPQGQSASNNINATGNALDNYLEGNDGNNSLSGLLGDDTLSGGSGNDTLQGGDGDDNLAGGDNNDSLAGGAGNDSLDGNAGADILDGGAGDDTIGGVENNEAVTGGIGNDAIYVYATSGAAPNLADGGGPGEDTLYLQNESLSIYTLHVQLENVIVSGEGIELVGNASANHLAGTDNNDTLRGGGANDVLIGGEGSDALFGGAGNDIYSVDNSGDRVIELLLADGAADTVFTSLNEYLLPDLVEHLVYGGFGGEGVSENFYGRGNALGNSITGSANGSNTLNGMAGNDTLDAAGGSGVLIGGAGNDTYIVDDSNLRVSELAGGGALDIVRSSVDQRLSLNVENLVLTGSGNTSGWGNGLNNTLSGNAGDNTLDGGRGNDSMAGGKGDDVYRVDSTLDVVTELANEGNDTVVASATFTLASVHVEGLELHAGAGSINGTGNAGNNIIAGNTGRNVLSGLGGNDVLYGNRGNDSLLGGEGNDLLDGGSGADAMDGGNGNDVLVVNQSGDSAVGGAGIDLVESSVNFTLGATVENLTLMGGAISGTGNNENNNVITGNGLGNVLSGLNGNDTLNGGGGNDSMTGGNGNDTYRVDSSSDAVVEGTGAPAGIADLVISTASYTLASNVENLTLEGGAFSGEGNTGNNLITGTAGGNNLNGVSGADTLLGLGGNDTLDGGNDSMADRLEGGAGNDVYMLDSTNSANDVIVELANAGTDEVQAIFSFTLGATSNLENLLLLGEGNLNGTGNGLNNVILGTAGNNTIRGLGGNDFLMGGGGSDRLEGGDGNDALFGNTFLGGDDQAPDTLDGGLGNDTFNVYQDDMVLADAGGANDVARLLNRDSFDAGDVNIEEVNHFGSSGTAIIAGGSANNLIRALDFSTSYTLNSGGGNDTVELSADTGTHSMNGGTNIDVLNMFLFDYESVNVSIAGVETVNISGIGDLSIVEADDGITTSYVIEDLNTTGPGDALSISVGGAGGLEALTLTLRGDNDFQFQGEMGALTVRSEFSGSSPATVYLNQGSSSTTITGDESLNVIANDGDTIGVADYNGAALTFNQSAGPDGTLFLKLDNVNTTLNVNDFADAFAAIVSESEIVLNANLGAAGTFFFTGDADLDLTVASANTGLDFTFYDGDLTLLISDDDGVTVTFGVGADFVVGGGGNDDFIFLDLLNHEDHVEGGGGNDTLSADVSAFGDLGQDPPLTLDIENVEEVYLSGNVSTELHLNAAGIRGYSTLFLEQGASGGAGWTITGLNVNLDAGVSGMAVNDVEFVGQDQSATGSNFDDFMVAGEDSGQNVLRGGQGLDTLGGGGGSDALLGGYGNDTLIGGDGSDQFIFDTTPGTSVDQILDFDAGGEGDTLSLNTDVFAAFAGESGSFVDADNFATFNSSGTGVEAAGNANSYLKYDTFTGNLYYDYDGLDGTTTAAVLFASFNDGEGTVFSLAADDIALFSLI